MEGFAAAFAGLEDPRTGNAKRHLLLELLLIALCAVLSGGESCADMALFGQVKQPFLRQFLSLPHGVPSHDTFSRVFRRLDPEQFRACFATFMQRFARSCQGVVAVDGKTLRDEAPLPGLESSREGVEDAASRVAMVKAQFAVLFGERFTQAMAG